MTYKNIIKIGYITCLIAGVILHFAYNFFNNNILIGLITPINESVTEHLKLVFLPFSIFTIFFYIYSKKKITNIFLVSFFANILGLLATTISFYIGIQFLGMNNTLFNISTYIIGMTIAFVIFYLGIYNYKLSNATNDSNILGISAIMLLLFFFVVNTISPLKIPINKDPVTNTYGIFNTK